MAIGFFAVPLDMSDIDCTIPQLLRSSYCRIGWAYAVSAVCCMISIACPVLGKLAVDRAKPYEPLPTTQEHYL
ncbi:hypothetical protein WR25_20977 [Diploscapter pachys]|uniref:Uncharacterized protein n=1 Tax=Diploscapter pachys TaxID=2018661 RepID=A0A2A2JM82_9BILA|nr:hypothetical protein WR25_23428 [Diploscapter pachys]PAV68798.1 hypothetical protein WR25_20977 [Diploscapter pachys]